MIKRHRKLIYAFLRIGLGAIFVTLVVRGVVLHDRVVLEPERPDQPERRFRLIGEDESTVTFQNAAGEEKTVPRGKVAIDEKGSERITRGLITALRGSDPRILLLAFAAFGPVTLLQSFRLQLMLRAQEIRLTYWECTKLSFGGNFLNFVFPIGSTGGDVFKAYYTSLHTSRKTEAVTTILLDRIVGMSGLLVVAAAMSFTGSDEIMLRRVRLIALALLAVFSLGGVIVVSPYSMRLNPRRFFGKLPGIAHVKRIHGATERLIHHKPLLLLCLLTSVVLQFLAVGGGVLCARSLHMDFSGAKVWDYFAYIGSGHVVAAIPISVLGLGTMEFAYKHFFLGDYGTLAQLLCLALWIRLLQLFWSLPGAFFTLFGAYRPRNLESSTPATQPK